MPSVAFTKSDSFIADIASGFHRFASDTLKICLTNTAVTSATIRYNQVTEIAATGGYVTGGFVVQCTNTTYSSGTYRMFLADKVLTAAGAAFPTFRYVVLYNAAQTTPVPAQAGSAVLARSTASGLIGWASPFAILGYYDYGSAVDIPDGQTFTMDFDATNGVFSI